MVGTNHYKITVCIFKSKLMREGRQRKKLSFLEKCNEVFLKMDLFANPEFLKYKGEGAYQTYGGSTISVLIVLAFFVLFFNIIKSTVNREKIVSVSKLKPSYDSTFRTNESDSAFMFAVGLEGFNLSHSERFFDFYMSAKIFKNSQPFSSVDVPLVPCSIDQWSGINQQFERTFTRLNFNAWLCPPKNFSFEFKGKYSSQEYRYTKIVVRKCTEAFGGTCANATAFSTALFNQKTFKLNVYFANPIIDPSEKNYLDYVLEDTSYFEFTDMVGVSSHIFFSEYEVNTDSSILPEPMSDVTSEKGITLNERPVVSNFQIINTNEFVRIFLRKADLILQYDRSYTRLDATFAYVGGLFGMVLILFYGMKAYSEYAFQFEIGGNLFVNNDRKEFQTKKFHLLRFPIYLLYCIVTFFYAKAEDWECFSFYRTVDDCRDEVKEQTDVCFLIKRVIYIQKAIEMFFGSRLERLSIDHRWAIDQAWTKREFYDDHTKIQQMIRNSEKSATNVKRREDVSMRSVDHNILNPNKMMDENIMNPHPQTEIKPEREREKQQHEIIEYDGEIHQEDIDVRAMRQSKRNSRKIETESRQELKIQQKSPSSSKSSKKKSSYKEVLKGSSSQSSGEQKKLQDKENLQENVSIVPFSDRSSSKKKQGLQVTKK